MNHEDDKAVRDLLKQVIGPVANTELRRDLWPQMRWRLEHQQPLRIPWFDWALAAIAGAALIFFPGAIPALLYHL